MQPWLVEGFQSRECSGRDFGSFGLEVKSPCSAQPSTMFLLADDVSGCTGELGLPDIYGPSKKYGDKENNEHLQANLGKHEAPIFSSCPEVEIGVSSLHRDHAMSHHIEMNSNNEKHSYCLVDFKCVDDHCKLQPDVTFDDFLQDRPIIFILCRTE
jgi:hypothetical protein